MRFAGVDRDRGFFKVNRQAFVDPTVLQEERRKVFDRCWLYVGHEAELPEAGNYVTRRVGGRPVILSCDTSGELRVFLNSCPHRGMVVFFRKKWGSSKDGPSGW